MKLIFSSEKTSFNKNLEGTIPNITEKAFRKVNANDDLPMLEEDLQKWIDGFVKCTIDKIEKRMNVIERETHEINKQINKKRNERYGNK